MKRKINRGIKWGKHNKIYSKPSSINPCFFEEERQEISDSYSDLEDTQLAIIKKTRRKSNKNKRELIADREKELGIQKTLEEVLRKESKSGKNKVNPS